MYDISIVVSKCLVWIGLGLYGSLYLQLYVLVMLYDQYVCLDVCVSFYAELFAFLGNGGAIIIGYLIDVCWSVEARNCAIMALLA